MGEGILEDMKIEGFYLYSLTLISVTLMALEEDRLNQQIIAHHNR